MSIPSPSEPSRRGGRSLFRPHRGLAPAAALALTLLGLSGSVSAADGWVPPPPSLPSAPPGATCVTIQRGGQGDVQDSEVAPTNGNWAAGAYPLVWTGLSASEHWALVKGDFSPVPPGSQIVLSTFSMYVGWNDKVGQVDAHVITADWSELTVKWGNFGGTASFGPASIASFQPSGVGYKSIDVTAITQAWYSGAVPNHGLLFEEGADPAHGYYSSEAGNKAYRPRFDVCYIAGGPCAGKVDGDGCDDGNLCTTGEVCAGGQCGGGQAVTCAAQDDCHDAGVCDPGTGMCTQPEKPDGSACADGDACTTGDACLSGLCVGGQAVSCFDGSACTADVCDPQIGCVNSTVSCDDGDACTADSCDPVGGCAHQAVTCDDGDACTADTCDPQTGCGIAPLSCDDGDACTVDGCDAQTGCVHSALSCSDGEICTTDSCDPQLGCVTAPVVCSDGLACTADACALGVGCEHVVACPPGAPCAQNFCNSPAGQTEAYAWFCN